MIGRLARFLSAPASDAAGADPVSGQDLAALRARMRGLDSDPYLTVADMDLGIISVFDDLTYDRADADMMSPAMRRHAIGKLKPLGFRQVSGTVLAHGDLDLRVLIPKFHALGASPFDITRYTPKRVQDFYLLTPTQTACRFIDTQTTEAAVAAIKALVAKHPINLFRLMDYLEKTPEHRAFLEAVGHLKYVQRVAVEGEPLRRRRALG